MAVPLVYSPGYNIRFFGIEKLHPFDSCKYEKIAAALCEQLPLRPDQLVDPGEPVDEDDLLDVHTPEYLSSLKSSAAIARVCELPPLAVLPYCILESRVLRPARLAVRGTMRAAELALAHGYAINLGGGMHHASAGAGGAPACTMRMTCIRCLRGVISCCTHAVCCVVHSSSAACSDRRTGPDGRGLVHLC
eukprot:m.98333 g.98333  ORF g.98333 m.98333 type:complete len:191 (+) comp8693_c0_seq1:178-750(+)